jgi:2-succinyl-5-enolpyruvyl-6-hydroxy-3-cyclohexene-1-carboxylate synthase
MPVSRDATTAFARALVDEWVRAGVTDAVVAPGSRSTPLALALAREPRCRVHVHVDERSAGGFALGLARASGRPAVLLCTSGTAAALFHAAVLEAHHGRVPLVVCTADRPPELLDVGAGQTVQQRGLYGGAVRWAAAPGPPEDRPGVGAEWRHLGARSVVAATGPPAGPVHLDLAFREPLVPSGAPPVDASGRADGRPWVESHVAVPAPDERTVAELAGLVREQARGVVVAGWGAGVEVDTAVRFAAVTGWPLLADPLSGLRVGPDAISTYEALLRVPAFADAHRPDAVLRVGALPTGKTLPAWLRGVTPTVLVDPDGAWLDPGRDATTRLACDPEMLLTAVADVVEHDDHDDRQGSGDHAWRDDWRGAERSARRAIDEVCDATDELFEGRIARDVVAALPDGAILAVASSMPVRDVEAFAARRDGVRFLANRGVNGIDGFVSTVLGAAAAAHAEPGGGPVVGLLGDLCFLHDVNGLVGAAGRDVDAVLVVVDNDGGGIFSFLPQASSDAVSAADFEAVFGTPHGLDLSAVARAHGVDCEIVEHAGDLDQRIKEGIAAGGVHVVLVRTDRSTNVARHRAVWDAVQDAVG